MPFGDRTGPEGTGPMTGRGAGYCAGSTRPVFGRIRRFMRWSGFGPGRNDVDRGPGMGWRKPGRGFGFRGASPPQPYTGIGRGGLPRHAWFTGDDVSPKETESEIASLQGLAQSMKDELSGIQSRTDELTKEKSEEN